MIQYRKMPPPRTTRASKLPRLIRKRFFVAGSLMVTSVLALSWYTHQVADVSRRETRTTMTTLLVNKSYGTDIVKNAYYSTFSHLEWCPEDVAMDTCLCETQLDDDKVPWWFQTMLRDAPLEVSLPHHYLSATTPNHKGLHFCTIGKIGTKHWRKLFCHLQNLPSNGGRIVCAPETPVDESFPHVVFLRDPLERFLSAFIDKCINKRGTRERHCEPAVVFLDVENGLLERLDASKKLLFAAYVETMPLKWNMHFFPQR